MMKLAVTALTLFLVLSPSQAKTSSVEKDSAFQKHSVSKTPTRTKSAVVRVVPKAQRRLLVTNEIDDSDDGPPGPNELDLHGSYARPRFKGKIDYNNTEELSDYITVRLAVARAKAMSAYRKNWA